MRGFTRVLTIAAAWLLLGVSTCTAQATTTTTSITSGTTTASPTSIAPTSTPTVWNLLPIRNGTGTRKCLDVRGSVYANGTPVQVYDCNETGAQKWQLTYGSTQVRVVGTNFCLDAGSNPNDGTQMKIWTCYNNLPAQTWYYTNDNRLVASNTALCLDLTNGDLTNSNIVQTWTCSDFNINQAWFRTPLWS